MQLIVVFMTIVLMSGLSMVMPPNHPPIAVDDQVTLLYHPVGVVEIPVLENDVDPEGRTLRITGLPLTEGAKAEIIDGKLVRVSLDWPPGGNAHGLIAHGAYLVSDGWAESKAEWFVWYWPEIVP